MKIEDMADNLFKLDNNSPFYRDLMDTATVYIKNIVQEFTKSELVNYNYSFTYDFYNKRTYEELVIYFIDYNKLNFRIMFNHEEQHYELYYFYNNKSNTTIFDKDDYLSVIPAMQSILKNLIK